MSNLLKALNALGEVKLSSEKVELSNIKELEQFLSIAKSNIKESESAGEKFAKAESAIRNAYSELMKHRNAIHGTWSGSKKVIDEFSKNAKNLGINANSIPEVKALQKESDELYTYVKFFDKIKEYKEQI